MNQNAAPADSDQRMPRTIPDTSVNLAVKVYVAHGLLRLAFVAEACDSDCRINPP